MAAAQVLERSESSKEQFQPRPLHLEPTNASGATEHKNALTAAKAPGLDSAQKTVGSQFDGSSTFQIVTAGGDVVSGKPKSADIPLPNGGNPFRAETALQLV